MRMEGCEREYDALGDSDWKQCIRTGVSKLWAVGSIQSDASFRKVVLNTAIVNCSSIITFILQW